MHAQLKVICIRRIVERRLVSHQPRLKQVPQRLIECLHPVLRRACRNRVPNRARLFRHQNTFPDVRGINHHLNCRNSPFAIGPLHQALANDRSQHRRQLQPNLLLLRRRKHRNNSVDGFNRVQSMQGRENHMPGFRRVQRRPNGFHVTHFAHQNHVRILTQRCPQRRRKTRRIHLHLALVHISLLIAMQKFNRILNRNNMFRPRRVHPINHRRQRSRFTRPGHPRDQHQPARHLANLLNHLGQIKLIQRPNLSRNDAQHQPHIPPLLKHVHTKPPQASNAVRHVDFRDFFEFLFLARRHHAERHGQHVFGSDTRLIGQRHQFAVNSQVRIVSDLQVQVGRLSLHGHAQQIIYMHRKGLPGIQSVSSLESVTCPRCPK